VIEIDDLFSKYEIDNFISQEDVYDWVLGNKIDIDVIQYNFFSNLPPFLKTQEDFSSIRHDLKQITEKTKVPFAKQAQPLPTIEPIHCENCLH